MPEKRIVVTIDGPAGVGKTTLAKRLAQSLGIAYLDTGAMFRTLGYKLGADASCLSENELNNRLGSFHFTLSGSGEQSVLSVNGTPMGDEIRTEEVAMLGSKVATIPAVRQALKDAQQNIGANTSLVAEGRDMGTVVFPDAEYKIFLDATAEARAERRCKQLEEMGNPADMELITKQIRERDEQDRNRPIAPLKAAEDATIIDTTALDIDGVFNAMLTVVNG